MKDCGTPKVLEIKCPGEVVLLHKVIVTPDMGDETTFPPKIGLYKNVLLQYQSSGNIYLYSSDGIPTKIEDTADIARLEQMIEDETEARILKDEDLQDQIDTIKAASDVVDIVGSYAELEAYDTSKLNDNDIIKVLEDETHDDDITYYRWSTTTETFTYIGAQAAYYSKGETDTLLSGKQDTLVAGNNIQIAEDGVTISATDTTYTHFTGATASTDGVQGLVPGPLAGDQDKVLKGDGTWGEAAANTIFYRDSSETGATRHIYKNADMTGAVSMQDLLDANEKGQVILRLSTAAYPEDYSDAYLQNAYVGANDYQMLFLDEKAYTSFDTTQPTDTTFYYSRRELQDKLTAGTNIQINGTTISATDTTYSNFVGTDGQTAGSAGLVPAPATTDDGKYLKADGTWSTLVIPPSVNVINTIATNYASASTTDAMGQRGVYLQVHSSNNGIQIGSNSTTANVGTDSNAPKSIAIGGASSTSGTTNGLGRIAIGYGATAGGQNSMAVGTSANAGSSGYSSNLVVGNQASVGGDVNTAIGIYAKINSPASYNVVIGSGQSTSSGYRGATVNRSSNAVAIGYNAYVDQNQNYSIAFGTYSKTGRSSELSIGDGSSSSNYGTRFIANVRDGILAQDAVTVSQLTTGLASKQNTLTAGTGISIVGDTISATGGAGAVLSMADWNNVFNNA